MRKSKFFTSLLVSFVFISAAAGCGRETPKSTTTVKIESDSSQDNAQATEAPKSSTPTTKPTEKPTATPTSVPVSEVQYKVTDTKFDYYINSIGIIEYFGIVEIENTGSCNLYLSDATFDLEDNNGHLLQSDNFISKAPSVIKPGEKGYFYNGLGASSIDDGVSLSNGVKLVPQITVAKATGTASRCEVTDESFRKGTYGSPTITGRLVNNTSKEMDLVSVDIIFYDSNQNVLAIASTTEMDIPANGKKSFECSPLSWNDHVSLEDVGYYKIIAEEYYYQF